MREKLWTPTTSIQLNQKLIQEIKNEFAKTGKFFVTGILQRAGSKNQNGRVYPKEVLVREANRYLSKEIREGRAYGELDHPDSSIVLVKNSSHTVEDLWWNGDDLWGKLEILDTPNGNIVRNILLAGKTLGISSRGLGSVETIDESTVEVQQDFEIICWDFVSNPSTQGAFMKALNENVDPMRAIDKYAEVNRIITQILHTEF